MTNEGHIGIWGPPVADDSNAPVKKTRRKVNNTKNLPATRRIRWGTSDFFIGMGLMILAQILMSAWVIADFLLKNGENGLDLEDIGQASDAAALTDAVLKTATSGPFLFVSALTMYISWMYAVRRASNKRGLGSLAKDFWIKFNWKRDIIIGLIAAVVLRGAEFGVINGLTALGVDLSGADNSSIITSQSGFWFFINAIVVAIFLAPLFEEIFFRGLFLQSLLRLFRTARPRTGDTSVDLTPLSSVTGVPMGSGVRLGKIVEMIVTPFYKARNYLAAIISAAVFGFMHFQGTDSFGQWFVVIETGVIGLIMALLVYRTKRVGTSIFAHIFFNGSGILLSVLLGS